VTVLAATGGSHALWYLTRASGVVALLLLTWTMVLGVVSASRWRSERWPRFAVADLHRNLTLVALLFVATHVVANVVDSFAPIAVQDAFIPFVSPYRPLWLGFGALALDLLLVLTVSSLLRKRIAYRAWRLLHWAAYGVWPLAWCTGSARAPMPAPGGWRSWRTGALRSSSAPPRSGCCPPDRGCAWRRVALRSRSWPSSSPGTAPVPPSRVGRHAPAPRPRC
jgi:hypothetical protein